jgi:pimeloyl-ACP methyl ester carboxylesterase
MMSAAATRYARAPDGDSIAYQVHGDGPFDLIFIPGFVSHVEMFWTDPTIAAFYSRLASFSRFVLFDKRGTGLSDPLTKAQTIEERFRDVESVMDAVGSERAAVIGVSEGCAMASVFAATYPERTRALVLCGAILGGPVAHHPAPARWEDASSRFLDAVNHWGTGRTVRLVYPTSPSTDEQLGIIERGSASPRMAREILDMWFQIDLRDVLSAISMPTLVLHHTDEVFPFEAARHIAARIPHGRLVEVPGIDHVPWGANMDQYVDEIEEFLTGVRERRRVTHRLSTLLVTDVVESTALAAEIGDASWRQLLLRHDEITRGQLRRFDGYEVKHTGDGIIADFDGPARAIRCGQAIVEALARELNVQVRVGMHTGEVEVAGDDVRGLAVHIAARINAFARPGEVLVSNTVRELVMGSGIEFEDRGTHELKGIPDRWRLHAVAST